MEAQTYYQSLLDQGYTADQAQQYTVQHYPDFVVSAPIPAPAPFQPAFPEPQFDMPPPSHGVQLSQPESGGSGTGNRVKIIAIASVALLIIGGGTVGVLYAVGVLGAKETTFADTKWVNGEGGIAVYHENGTLHQYDWSLDDRVDDEGLWWSITTSWDKSGDEISILYEYRNNNAEFPYDEKFDIVMKIKIVDDVIFMNVLEATETREYDDGEVIEEDIMDNIGETCQASVSKNSLEFNGEYWDGDAQDEWYSIVNSVEKPSWCETEFKNEYTFSFTKTDNFFDLTLETSKWDQLPIYEMEFFISVNGGSEIECFYDGYEDACSYIPQFGSSNIYSGDVISFGRAQAWDIDCSSGCDLDIRIAQVSDGTGEVIWEYEISKTNLVWEQDES